MTLEPGLLAILACPRCGGAVEEIPGGKALLCRACRLLYPVDDGIPLMLAEKAVAWTGGEGKGQGEER
jgi:uncharacterized protein YbaR (Trm112 family)